MTGSLYIKSTSDSILREQCGCLLFAALQIRGRVFTPAYFIEGITMPFMMMRLAKKNTMSGGMLTSAVAAIT